MIYYFLKNDEATFIIFQLNLIVKMSKFFFSFDMKTKKKFTCMTFFNKFTIIFFSYLDSIRVLNKKLDIFSGIKSPLKIISHDNDNVRTDERRSAN